ncbi:GntR family transcriptional regulator [Frondihabitans sp. PAMC 28766]|uniref:FadR/GntR family transcriptional regulator n=1 Tax=Frondihabitans sp. PAMC 28766 TaxID=1795630 RepID=UPI00078CF888|nr:FadR/GntR family transcriptional regulator [Frondihabitans sp. PAMC 28766]AMM21858.1 GntR family transcriptional regulator [Frondihabitans sp. PAMC 28766]
MPAPESPGVPDRSSIQLSPMKVPKASDVLANELRERILTGEFAEGMGLPPERDLVVQTRMSRTTVREALRILEVQGLIRIKSGRTGGAFVQQPGEEAMASTVNLLIRGRQIRLAALLETREAIEPYCAELAAAHRTESDLTDIEAANVALRNADDDLTAFLEANVEWHVAVARASHNELLSGLMMALSRAIFAATLDETFVDVEVRKHAIHAHETITEAIREGDAAAALRRMKRHVYSYAEEVLKSGGRSEVDVP